jgi:hypothetical protein
MDEECGADPARIDAVASASAEPREGRPASDSDDWDGMNEEGRAGERDTEEDSAASAKRVPPAPRDEARRGGWSLGWSRLE